MSEENNVANEKVEKIDQGDGFNHCTIVFKGKFYNDSVLEVFESLRFAPKLPLVVYLNSEGGSIHVGLVFLELLKSLDVPITFVSELFNASMSCMLPHAEDFIRLCYPHSVFVYHGPNFNASGSEKEIAVSLEYSYEGANYWKNIFKDAVGLTTKEMKDYTTYDHPIFGYKALDVGTKGMVDGVIIKDLRNGQFLCKTRGGLKVIDVRKHRRGDIAGLPVVEESQYK